MTLSDRARWLIDRYFDDGLAEIEIAELEQLMRSEPVVAAAFVATAQLESSLRDELARDRDAAVLDDIFQRAEAASGSPVVVAPPSPMRPEEAPVWSAWSHWVPSLVLIAAPILLGVAFLAPRQEEKPQVAKVVSGQILVDNKPVKEVPFDRVFTAASREGTRLTLADGSQVTLQIETRGILHSPEGEIRQRVELQRGQATFDVAQADRSFRVETAVMQLIVAGTKFSVRVVPAAGAGERRTEERVEIHVAEGRVVVDPHEGETRVMNAGERRVFPGETRDRPREKEGEDRRDRPLEPRRNDREVPKREEPRREEPRRDEPRRETPRVDGENAERVERLRREEELRRNRARRESDASQLPAAAR